MWSSDWVPEAFVLIIPIVAIIGGISVAIVRLLGQQRLEELARKERIAAIERGLDPDKIPSLTPTGVYEEYGVGNGRLRRAHGLMIAGLILVAVGVGVALLIQSQEPDKNQWLVGLLPALVGGALLMASKIIWPKPKA
ncbi:MAG TPA: hypothetical protein VF363_02355 [Candidatus Eisenbacteria bacterium]